MTGVSVPGQPGGKTNQETGLAPADTGSGAPDPSPVEPASGASIARIAQLAEESPA